MELPTLGHRSVQGWWGPGFALPYLGLEAPSGLSLRTASPASSLSSGASGQEAVLYLFDHGRDTFEVALAPARARAFWPASSNCGCHDDRS